MTRYFILLLLLFTSIACQVETPKASLDILPQPALLIPGEGEFVLKKNTRIHIPKNDKALEDIALMLGGHIFGTHKASRRITTYKDPETIQNGIVLLYHEGMQNPEAYQLEVLQENIRILASDPRGFFYAIQSLRQMLPVELEGNDRAYSWRRMLVPTVQIVDSPAFPYRGMHLDVARHFFPVEFIKKYIDLMAMHKMNHFHWHLTEDQGWRIQIMQYPELTKTGAFRSETLIGHGGRPPFVYDGEPYGGYYTQDDIREVIAYAAQRHIAIIPEIEMPGHATAALASYPELGCTGGPYEVITRWGVFEDVFCAGKEEVFVFLENVLLEVMELFPGHYIHIGGDECPKTRWRECDLCQERILTEGLANEYELQSWFIRRISAFLNSHGRSLIGWDEILEGGLAKDATVMSWRGTTGGIEAARMGHDVIMSPVSHCYFDYYQADPATQPLAIGGYTTLEKVYGFNPVPDELNKSEVRHILGAQGNVWTEYMKTAAHVEYMAYPRAIALAEVLWTPRENHDYLRFTEQLKNHFKRLDKLQVNYFNPFSE